MPNIQLARNLKYLRRANRLTQDDLGQILSISRQAYSNYENSKRTPDLDTLMRLSGFYQISLDALVKESMACPDDLPRHVAENASYDTGISTETGHTIYLTKEETEFLLKFRTLSSANQKILKGFLDSYSMDI